MTIEEHKKIIYELLDESTNLEKIYENTNVSFEINVHNVPWEALPDNHNFDIKKLDTETHSFMLAQIGSLKIFLDIPERPIEVEEKVETNPGHSGASGGGNDTLY